jgi:hypothetical protein
MTYGPIKRFKKAVGLGPKKGSRKGKKRKQHSGSTFRDYRGIEGALDDAYKGK